MLRVRRSAGGREGHGEWHAAPSLAQCGTIVRQTPRALGDRQSMVPKRSCASTGLHADALMKRHFAFGLLRFENRKCVPYSALRLPL